MIHKAHTLPSVLLSPASSMPAMSLTELLSLLEKEGGMIVSRTFGDGRDIVVFCAQAAQEFFTQFQFGRGMTPVNCYEQQAKLYGHRIQTTDHHRVYVVTRVAYIYPAERRKTFVATSGKNEDDFFEHRLRLEQHTVNQFEMLYTKDAKGYSKDDFLNCNNWCCYELSVSKLVQ